MWASAGKRYIADRGHRNSNGGYGAKAELRMRKIWQQVVPHLNVAIRLLWSYGIGIRRSIRRMSLYRG